MTTVHFSVWSSRGTLIAKPLVVYKFLNRLLIDIRTLCDLSAIPKSKWNANGVPALDDLTSKYKYLPFRFKAFNNEFGCGICIKLFIDIEP
jgi:hypothetical protein